MANSNRLVSAVVGLTAIVGGAVFGVAVMSSTYAANNFSSKNGFCKIVKPTEKSEQGLCVCPSQAAYDRYRLQHPGAAAEACLIEGAQNRVSSESTAATERRAAERPVGERRAAERPVAEPPAA